MQLAGQTNQCLTSIFLNKDKIDLTEKEAAWIAGTMLYVSHPRPISSLQTLISQPMAVGLGHPQCVPFNSSQLWPRNDMNEKISKTDAVQKVFVLAMVSFPEVMKKAQQEIDRVVGRSRLPTFQDRSQLPYLRALIREVRTVTWRGLGIPNVECDLSCKKTFRWRSIGGCHPMVWDGYFVLMIESSLHA